MKIINQLFLLIVMVAFASCSPSINYLGKSYTPTTNVEVFYDNKDISHEYEVMGIMKNEGNEFESDDLEEIQKEMMKIAREKGADAVLIENAYTEKRNMDYTTGDSEFSITNNSSSKVLAGKLIKYKTK